MIKSAVKTAEEYVFPKLKIDWDIDVLVTNRIPMIIPENGAGGYTFTADFSVLLLTIRRLQII